MKQIHIPQSLLETVTHKDINTDCTVFLWGHSPLEENGKVCLTLWAKSTID